MPARMCTQLQQKRLQLQHTFAQLLLLLPALPPLYRPASQYACDEHDDQQFRQGKSVMIISVHDVTLPSAQQHYKRDNCAVRSGSQACFSRYRENHFFVRQRQKSVAGQAKKSPARRQGSGAIGSRSDCHRGLDGRMGIVALYLKILKLIVKN